MVARLHVGNTLTDGLNEAGTLVTEDNRESTLGVLAGQSVGIYIGRGMSVPQCSDMVRNLADLAEGVKSGNAPV